VENFQGVALFQLVDLGPGNNARVSATYRIDVYAVETNIRSPAVQQNINSPIHSIYTMPSRLIPSDNELVIAQAAAIVGNEQNPYERARRIYEWLIREAGIQARPLNSNVVEALEKRENDAYTAVLLFCALARAANIPVIPVAGVLINRYQQASRHYWAEFWIDGFGWVPVDPALGAGAAPSGFDFRANYAAYYFGNLDNQRIAFSRGEAALPQLDPRGRLASRPYSYALQNIWEEAIGGLEAYASVWSDIIVMDMR
jgi:transglutaminase-like putative cysteine protease